VLKIWEIYGFTMFLLSVGVRCSPRLVHLAPVDFIHLVWSTMTYMSLEDVVENINASMICIDLTLHPCSPTIAQRAWSGNN